MRGHVQGPRDSRDRFKRRHVDLLNFAVNVFAFSARLVEGNLLDEEILRPILDRSADAGKAFREVWEIHVHSPNRTSAACTPWSLFDGATQSATCFTTATALSIATATPATSSICTSLAASPMAITFCIAMP